MWAERVLQDRCLHLLVAAMDPDRAAPHAGDNLTAVRDILARAAVQLNNATTGGRASKKFADLIMMITPVYEYYVKRYWECHLIILLCVKLFTPLMGVAGSV